MEGTILHREEGSHEWARYFASITADLRHLQLFDPRIDDTSGTNTRTAYVMLFSERLRNGKNRHALFLRRVCAASVFPRFPTPACLIRLSPIKIVHPLYIYISLHPNLAAPPQKRLSLAQLGKPLGPGPGLIIQFSCGQRRHQMQLSHPEEARNWMAALEEAEQLQGTLQSQRAAPGTTFAGAMLTGVTAQPRHLEEMPAFIGPVDRLAAEDLLVEALPRFPGGTYVIRISPRDGKLVLSWLRASDKMGHVKVRGPGRRAQTSVPRCVFHHPHVHMLPFVPRFRRTERANIALRQRPALQPTPLSYSFLWIRVWCVLHAGALALYRPIFLFHGSTSQMCKYQCPPPPSSRCATSWAPCPPIARPRRRWERSQVRRLKTWKPTPSPCRHCQKTA